MSTAIEKCTIGSWRLAAVLTCASMTFATGCTQLTVPKQVAYFAENHMFRIETPTGLGSGFWMSDEFAITSGHALPDEDDLIVRYSEEGTGESSRVDLDIVAGGRSRGLSLRDDWALLRSRGEKRIARQGMLPIMKYPPESGTRVIIAGLLERDFAVSEPFPRFVNTEVCAPPKGVPGAIEEGSEEVITWVKWPRGFAAYGFSGGPAFAVRHEGHSVELFGFCVALEYRDGQQYGIIRRLTMDILRAAGAKPDSGTDKDCHASSTVAAQRVPGRAIGDTGSP